MSSNVKRFTTEYIADEDRMRFSVEFGDGSVQVLWLTRRLLDRLLARLLTQIDTAPLPGGGNTNPVAAQAQQKFNQQVAASSIKPQKPVRVTMPEQQARPPALVTSVDLHSRTTVLHLDFKSGNTILARIPFRKEALRQWLNVLYIRYKGAGWTGTAWPAWIKPEDETEQAASLAPHRMN